MINKFVAFSTSVITLFSGINTPIDNFAQNTQSSGIVLARQELDLNNRYPVNSVNEVFSDNIILYLHYMNGSVTSVLDTEKSTANRRIIDWEKARKPLAFSLTLSPNEVFVFHPDVLKEFDEKNLTIVDTSFGSTDGYRFIAGLWGNGVCHIASLINWVSKEAGLTVTSKVNHDFAVINGIEKKFGTAIYYLEGSNWSNQAQNLYIENPYSFPVTLNFTVVDSKVVLTITAIGQPSSATSPKKS